MSRSAQLAARRLELLAGLGVGLLQHVQELLGVGGVLRFAVDVRRHLLEQADESRQALLQGRLAGGVGLAVDLALEVLCGGQPLARELGDGVRLLLLTVVGGAGLGHLPAEPVQVLLHGAKLRLGGRFWVPLDERFDRAADRLVRLHADEVAHEIEHGGSSLIVDVSRPWRRR
jgi:hypothetical protein